MAGPATYCFCGWIGEEADYKKHVADTYEGNVAKDTLALDPDEAEPMETPHVDPRPPKK